MVFRCGRTECSRFQVHLLDCIILVPGKTEEEEEEEEDIDGTIVTYPLTDGSHDCVEKRRTRIDVNVVVFVVKENVNIFIVVGVWRNTFSSRVCDIGS